MSNQIKHTPGPVGISLAAYVSEKGEGFLGQAVYDAPPCGCKVIGNGTLTRPLTIQYCPAHKSAPELLAASETLRSAMVHLQEFDRLPDDTCPADLIDYLSAALKKAMGKSIEEPQQQQPTAAGQMLETLREIRAWLVSPDLSPEVLQAYQHDCDLAIARAEKEGV